jgi:copper chaperone CopZ
MPSQKPVVEKTLYAQEGVEHVAVNVLQRQATVTHDVSTSAETMVRALNRLGLKAAVLSTEQDPGAAVSTTLFVNGICCASEVPVVEQALYTLPAVQLVTVNVLVRGSPDALNPTRWIRAFPPTLRAGGALGVEAGVVARAADLKESGRLDAGQTKTATVVHGGGVAPQMLAAKLNSLGLDSSVLATSKPGEAAQVRATYPVNSFILRFTANLSWSARPGER